jgi:hypothetical protein
LLKRFIKGPGFKNPLGRLISSKGADPLKRIQGEEFPVRIIGGGGELGAWGIEQILMDFLSAWAIGAKNDGPRTVIPEASPRPSGHGFQTPTVEAPRMSLPAQGGGRNNKDLIRLKIDSLGQGAGGDQDAQVFITEGSFHGSA